MTDQADPLAGKLADVPKRHSAECRARGGDPCECFGYPDYDAMVVVATAHFAEEIARMREENERLKRIVNDPRSTGALCIELEELQIENERLKGIANHQTEIVLEAEAHAEQAEQRYQNACEALRIETEEADALERKLEQAEAALARVREFLESIPADDAEDIRAMRDELLALLAPEGK